MVNFKVSHLCSSLYVISYIPEGIILINCFTCFNCLKPRNVAPVEAVSRPKGQGLGADRGPGPKQQTAKGKGPEGNDEPEGFVKGAGILVTRGAHKNLYGLVNGDTFTFLLSIYIPECLPRSMFVMEISYSRFYS